MPRVFLGAGSNLGDRVSLLNEAADRLARIPGIVFRSKSNVYETAPVDSEGGKFLNAVWEIQTELSPRELLSNLLSVESAMGRVRTRRNDARPIDLDILLYDERIIEEQGLSVPHPRMHERWFVLKPLSDLASGLRHPAKNKTVADMLKEVKP